MAKFCGKCGSPLNESGLCPHCDVFVESTSRAVKQKKKRKRVPTAVLAVVLLLISAIGGVVLAEHEGLIAFSPQSDEKSALSIDQALRDGEISQKEFKSFVKNGAVRSGLDNSELIVQLCEIEEEFPLPIEGNRIAKEDAEKEINSILGRSLDFENFWTSDSWYLCYFENENWYIFLEYSYSYQQVIEGRHYRVFRKTDGRFYQMKCYNNAFVCVYGSLPDGESYLGEKGKKPAEYIVIFVDSVKKKMVCGYAWAVFTNSSYGTHTIFDEKGNAEFYALYCGKDDAYFDSKCKASTEDEYYLVIEKHNEYMRKTYNYTFGSWGI